MSDNRLVQTIWTFCHTLRDDGVSYLDYLEQITYLLFLKIVDDTDSANSIPAEFRWSRLRDLKGRDLEACYLAALQELSRKPGALGAIFDRAQNKIQDPAKLMRLITLIEGQDWPSLGSDTKGAIYEGLLQKNAEDTKSGAGQYFTPRALTRAIVACLRPQPKKTVYDPACGTGGFFLAVNDWLLGNGDWPKENKGRGRPRSLTTTQLDFLRYRTFYGAEIVPSTRRLCLMNLYLRGIGSPTEEPLIQLVDALIAPSKNHFDYVLANPPFGSRSSMSSVLREGDEELTYSRPDFWAPSANKQLNFLQHIAGALADGGSAAVVVPDNVLFSAGAGERVRRRLLEEFDVHTLLRLPTGIFYAQGVRANVLFFDKSCPNSRREAGVWVYDLRSGMRFTLRGRPIKPADLDDFIKQYSPVNRSRRSESERFRFFAKEAILDSERTSLDLAWPMNSAGFDEGPSVDELHIAVIEQLEAALEAYKEAKASLSRYSN